TLELFGGGPSGELAVPAELPPALSRLTFRELAQRAAGEPLALSRADAGAILALGGPGGSRSLDLGGGLTATVEYGTLRFRRGGEEPLPDAAVPLPVPGVARFGAWRVEACPGAGEALVSARALAGALTVRGWREGDRMRPVGLGGTKTLQDLFTDRKVPRALRRSLPIVEAQEGIVWVAGLALDERFAAASGDPQPIGLSARRVR
ncbi:MAG: tRNA lysidine(34) synthetase TilS, partial [Thermoleophilaceae bacterium]